MKYIFRIIIALIVYIIGFLWGAIQFIWDGNFSHKVFKDFWVMPKDNIRYKNPICWALKIKP